MRAQGAEDGRTGLMRALHDSRRKASKLEFLLSGSGSNELETGSEGMNGKGAGEPDKGHGFRVRQKAL